MVRTDPQTRKITTMFPTQAQPSVPETTSMDESYEIVPKDRVPMKLGSVRELREEVMKVAHNGIPFNNNLISELTELFANHTFVGIVDGWRRLAAVQHGVKLYLVDYGAVWYVRFIPSLIPVTNSFISLVSQSLATLARLNLQRV
jgi:DNA mismatch repair protein MLH1